MAGRADRQERVLHVEMGIDTNCLSRDLDQSLDPRLVTQDLFLEYSMPADSVKSSSHGTLLLLTERPERG